MGRPASGSGNGDEDEEDEGMLRMSFLEHLEELRSRIIKIIIGIFVALCVSFTFTDPLWNFVVKPAKAALTANGFPPTLAQITPMEAFNVVWFKLPIGLFHISGIAMGAVPGLGFHLARPL